MQIVLSIKAGKMNSWSFIDHHPEKTGRGG